MYSKYETEYKITLREFISEQSKHDIMNKEKVIKENGNLDNPTQLEPVLAQIEHINELGKSKWYEVVYFNESWWSYAGSKTFKDGERVIKWKYAKDCI